jgi:hypothetical protein
LLLEEVENAHYVMDMEATPNDAAGNASMYAKLPVRESVEVVGPQATALAQYSRACELVIFLRR